MTKKDLQQALPRFTQFIRRFGPLLEDDPRVARAEAYLRGLLLDADDNQNAETIALNAYGGDTSPVRMTQYFLGQSPWPYLPLRAELVLGPGQAIRHSWVTFDEGYGKGPGFLSRLEEARERYIGEVPKSVRVWLERPGVEEPGRGSSGRSRRKPRVRADQPAPQTVEQIAAALPARAWQRLACREGTKGTQPAEFARLRVVPERDDLPGPELGLVVERGPDQETKVKYYLSNADPKVPLLTLAQVGHTRWPVEDCFWQGKQEVGLDA